MYTNEKQCTGKSSYSRELPRFDEKNHLVERSNDSHVRSTLPEIVFEMDFLWNTLVLNWIRSSNEDALT